MVLKFTKYKNCVLLFVSLFITNFVTAQSCPQNIDFENGTFDGWTCSTGSVFAVGTNNSIVLSNSGGPQDMRHTILPRSTYAGQNDQYGNFPVNCPNGSAYSVKLGNTSGGHEAEGVSYQFTIPAASNIYSLLYHYAVVFQNPNHLSHQQPRLEIEVKNITDDRIIDCSSFTFIPGTSLPGFYPSPITDSVLCKSWTPVTINLNGNAGKTIGITFKSADCTFNRHFGYAYIDVNTECNGEFPGASYCTDDTAVNIVGPSGFAAYNWYTNNFATALGTSQNLFLQPPPPTGTPIAVIVTPFNGYGCIDTLYATLIDTLSYHANAGADALLCGVDGNTILGVNPKQGFIYEWTPPLGLSSTSISNPIATPPLTTTYYLNVRNGGGGCRSKDTVVVRKSIIDTSMLFIGKRDFCAVSNDSAVFIVQPQNNIQWYKNDAPINAAIARRYRALTQGTYYATFQNAEGCIANTRKETVNIEVPPRGITYPDLYTLKNDILPLTARSFGGTLLWDPPLYLNNATALKPDFLSPIATTQQYRINIKTAAGCNIVDFQTVKVIDEILFFVPNAFTPNGDSRNDFFTPICIGATVKSFKIYNRFGQQIFSNTDNEKGWNGKFKGELQIPATYVWYLEAIGVNKKTYTRKGTVILIR
jgi:gliding motility-associated-like protein